MKKLFILVVILVSALWSGGTWFASGQTEAILDKMIVESNKSVMQELPFVKFKKQSFQKGFISSKAETKIIFDADKFEDNKSREATLLHTFYNGPVMVTPDGIKTGMSYIHTTLDPGSLPQDAKDIILMVFGNQEPFEANTLVKINGSTVSTLDIAPMTLDSTEIDLKYGEPNKETFRMTIGQSSALVTSNAEVSTLDGVIHFGNLKMVGKDEDGSNVMIEMAPSKMNIDIDELYRDAILVGSIVFNAPEATVITNDETVVIAGLSLKSAIEEVGQELSGSFVFDIESIDGNSDKVTDEIKGAGLHVSIGLEGLTKEEMKRLVDAEIVMNQNIFNSNDSDEFTSAEEYYLLALTDVIRKGIKSNFTIEARYGTGISAITLDLEYVDARKIAQLATIGDALKAVDGLLQITIDKDLLESISPGTGIEMGVGFLIDKGDKYEASVSLSNGELKANVDSLPIMEMIGPMADTPLPWAKDQGV